MKKLLLILLCLPMIGFGQCVSGDCDNGYGIYTYSDGGKYIGEWRNGNWDGQGIYTWADGTKHVGEWRYGKRQ